MKTVTEHKPIVSLPIELNGELMGVVDVTGYPAEIPEYAKLVRTTVETMLNHLSLHDQAHLRQQGIANWMSNLTEGDDFTPQRLESIAKTLKVDAHIPRAAFLIKFQDEELFPDNWDGRPNAKFNVMKSALLAEAAPSSPNEILICHTLERRLLLLIGLDKSMVSDRQLADRFLKTLSKLGASALVGIGNLDKGIEGYRQSFIQAKQSLKLLEKMKGDKKAAHINDWGIIDLMDRLPETVRHEFLTRYLPRFNELSEEMAETLRTFLGSDMNIKATVEKLHIHRNTLFYRLEKVHEVLELDPKKFNDAMIIQILETCSQLNAKDLCE